MSEQLSSTLSADVVDRLARLRAILPAMAADLASARRQVNALVLENERLTLRVAELESRDGSPREVRWARERSA